MRNLFVLLACAATLCVTAGCSDDECAPCAPVVSEQPLASISHGMGGGTSSAVGDSLRFNFVSSSADTLFDLYVTEADSGTVRTINAGNYPPFADAAARLSDGVNDPWVFWVRSVSGGFGAGNGSNESSWLAGGFTGVYTPDLQGAEITKIWLYINEVSIVLESGFTTFDIEARVVIMGRP